MGNLSVFLFLRRPMATLCNIPSCPVSTSASLSPQPALLVLWWMNKSLVCGMARMAKTFWVAVSRLMRSKAKNIVWKSSPTLSLHAKLRIWIPMQEAGIPTQSPKTYELLQFATPRAKALKNSVANVIPIALLPIFVHGMMFFQLWT